MVLFTCPTKLDIWCCTNYAQPCILFRRLNKPNDSCIELLLILVPRHSRHCNAVQFNPTEHNLIAAGLDKYRSDNSILIWDINKFNSNNEASHSGRMAVNTMAPAVELVKPIAEFAPSEVTYSLAWFYGSSKLLASGMNGKNIKIFDLRGMTLMFLF